MTRDDILRRLAEALRAQGQLFVASVAGTLVQVVLDEQRAIAREPGGAEAVAEAVGLRAVRETCDCCRHLACDAEAQGFSRSCRPEARIVAADPVSCVCHAGSVCADACQRGAHHGGCAAEKERGT